MSKGTGISKVSGDEEEEARVESLKDRFRTALGSDKNKPDFKELHLGSPVSPLRTHHRSRSGHVVSWAPLAAATTSSSSSSSGSVGGKNAASAGGLRRTDGGNGSGSHSGELSGSSEGSPTATAVGGSARSVRTSKPPGHRRSNSSGAPLIFSGGGSSASSPNVGILPSGNIFPSGKIGRTGMPSRSSGRSDVLGSGTVNYGHGSIVRGKLGGEASVGATGNAQLSGGESGIFRMALSSPDPEEVKRAGNEQYRKGKFAEALRLYDRAITLSPRNASFRCNRAAALIGLGQLVEAVKECEEALKFDPMYGRAHQRLACLHMRLGQVENARRHLFAEPHPDYSELQKLQVLERHMKRCLDSHKVGDWRSQLREVDAAIGAGADSSPHLFACRAEALLKLHQLEEAGSTLSSMPKYEQSLPSLQTNFFGMLCDSYPSFVRAQVEMALGRFDNAVAAAEKAGQIDPQSIEVSMMLNNVRSVARARTRGNDLFNSGRFTEACVAYGDGLKFDPSNPVLHCNRAACRFKLGQWEQSVDDCNEALKIHPNYTKALLRRATCYSKLERWVECVLDYERLRKELPGDKEVAEALFHSQIALKKSRGEDVYNLKFGGEVEEILGVNQFREAISSSGVSVVHFLAASNEQCLQISPFFDTLCATYPSLNFFKVDVDQTPAVAKAENVRIVPTFKIYKSGTRLKEMICPSQQVLEYSVRHYGF